MRHPGARGFACSSTVKINVLFSWEIFDLFLKVVGFAADGAVDAFSSDVVITVAAHVRDQDVVLALRSKAFGEFPRLYAGHDAVLLVLDELRDAIAGIDQQSDADDHFHGA